MATSGASVTTQASDSAGFAAFLRSATLKQTPQIRRAVADLAVMGLATREIDMKSLKATLGFVLKAANASLAQNPGFSNNAEAYLDAVALGIDDAMTLALKAIEAAARHFLAIGAKPDMAAMGAIVKTLEKFPTAFAVGLENAEAVFGEAHAQSWRAAGERLKAKSVAVQTAAKSAQALREAKGSTPEFAQFMIKGAQEIRSNMGVYFSGVLLGSVQKS